MAQSERYLVWLDLEMTGLTPERDRILEAAVAITDNYLNPVAEGPSFVLHQSEAILGQMDDWNVKQHTKSGLLELVRASNVTEYEAEQKILDFIKEYCKENTAVLCGNSIYQDRAFLRQWMPAIPAYLHYRIIDVSSIKELVRRWYPENIAAHFKKPETHRAMQDVYTSIEELKHYKKHFFV